MSNDFAVGFLKGLYQSGVGNPDVNRQRSLEQAQLDMQSAESGNPVVHPHTDNVIDKVRGVLFPGSNAYQGVQPTQRYGIDPSKGATVFPIDKPLPEGTVPMNRKEFVTASKPITKSRLQNISWDTATPDQKDLAKGLYEGKIQTSALSWKDRSIGTTLAIQYARENNLDPYVSYTGDTKAKAAQYWGTGKGGQNALSIDTALKHMGTLSKRYDELENLDERFMNIPINKLKKMTDDPNITGTIASLTAVQGELATAFKGATGTDIDHQQWAEALSPDLTPKQQVDMLTTIDELLRGRLGAMENSRSNVMDNPINKRELLSPKAKKVSEGIRNKNPLNPKSGLTLDEQSEFERLDAKYGNKK